MFDQPPPIEHKDLVSLLNCPKPVRHRDHGAVPGQAPQGQVDGCFGHGVQIGGWLVEQQDRRIAQDGPCDGQALPLAAREQTPHLAYPRVITVGEMGDEVVDLRQLGCCLDLRVGRTQATQPDVLANCRIEEEHILKDRPHLRSHRVLRHRA